MNNVGVLESKPIKSLYIIFAYSSSTLSKTIFQISANLFEVWGLGLGLVPSVPGVRKCTPNHEKDPQTELTLFF